METMDVYATLRDTLAGNRPVDDHARRSVLLMAERLDSLKQMNPLFSMVEFSPEMQQLAERSGVLLVS